MKQLLEIITQALQVESGIVQHGFDTARSHAKQITIPKRSGGYRTVWQPSNETKLIQYWLLQKVFDPVKLHPAAVAYRQNQNILGNAERHCKGKYFLRVDFRDFFPSIRPADLWRELGKNQQLGNLLSGWENHTHISDQNQQIKELITQCCFQRNDRLAQGYCTSPSISNIVMRGFDTLMADTLRRNPQIYGLAVYSRYSDDLVISSDIREGVKAALQLVGEIVSRADTPNLTIHQNKTRITSRRSGRALVTGLRITTDSRIQLTRQYRDKVELLLKLFSQGRLSTHENSCVAGHVNYIRMVDPGYWSKLNKSFSLDTDFLEKIGHAGAGSIV